MKRTVNIISFVLLMLLHQAGWSATGNLFTITGSGTVVTLDITACLNGKGSLSCQDYTVTRGTLSFRTVAPNHTYPAAGIKIRTPGYTVSGCTLFSNGYCLFSVSDTTPATIAATSTATPFALTSINPTSGAAAGGTSFTLTGANLTGATGVTFGGVAATNFNVVNSTTVTGVTPNGVAGAVSVVITTPQGTSTLTNGYTYQPNAIGQPTGGGVIACLNDGLNNLIAATADIDPGIVWGGSGTDLPGALSNTDGNANTTDIVNCLTNGQGAGCAGSSIGLTTYAAGLCSDYEVDSQGNTICEAGNVCYDDWFLPAGNNTGASGQLNCLFTNRVALAAAGAGFLPDYYWSSTEIDAVLAWGQGFAGGTQFNGNKASFESVRCVRAFTP